MTQSNTNPTLQKIQPAVAPKLAAHRDAIYLDPKLFARIKAIYDSRNKSGLDAEQKFLAERYYKNFVRSGAQLNEADKTALRALNQEQSKLTTQFRDRVLADTNASAIVIDDKSLLDGLPESDIAAAAERAKGARPGREVAAHAAEHDAAAAADVPEESRPSQAALTRRRSRAAITAATTIRRRSSPASPSSAPSAPSSSATRPTPTTTSTTRCRRRRRTPSS